MVKCIFPFITKSTSVDVCLAGAKIWNTAIVTFGNSDMGLPSRACGGQEATCIITMWLLYLVFSIGRIPLGLTPPHLLLHPNKTRNDQKMNIKRCEHTIKSQSINTRCRENIRSMLLASMALQTLLSSITIKANAAILWPLVWQVLY